MVDLIFLYDRVDILNKNKAYNMTNLATKRFLTEYRYVWFGNLIQQDMTEEEIATKKQESNDFFSAGNVACEKINFVLDIEQSVIAEFIYIKLADDISLLSHFRKETNLANKVLSFSNAKVERNNISVKCICEQLPLFPELE